MRCQLMHVHVLTSGTARAKRSPALRPSAFETWLLDGFRSGRTPADMAAEKGGKTTADTVIKTLLDVCCEEAAGLDPEALIPLVFASGRVQPPCFVIVAHSQIGSCHVRDSGPESLA